MAIAKPIYQFEERKKGIHATMMRVDEETRMAKRKNSNTTERTQFALWIN